MKTLNALIFSLTLLLGLGLTSCNRSDNVEAARETDAVGDHSSNLTAEEQEFLRYAAEMHAGEIKMAQLAREKSSDKDVREYADTVIVIHTEALKNLSDKTGLNRTLRNTNPSVDTQYHVQYLTPLSGDKFDQEFIALMIADHKDAASTFKDELNNTHNKALTSYVKDAQANLEKGLSDGEAVQRTFAAATR